MSMQGPPPAPARRPSLESSTLATSSATSTATGPMPSPRATVPAEEQAFFAELLRASSPVAPGVYRVRGVSVTASASLLLVRRALDEAGEDLARSPDDPDLLERRSQLTDVMLALSGFRNDGLDRVTADELAELLSIENVPTVFRAERSGTLASLMPPGSPQAAMADPDWGRNLLKHAAVPPASPNVSAPVSRDPFERPRNTVFLHLADAVVVKPELAARGVKAQDLEPIIDRCRRLQADYQRELAKWSLAVMVSLGIAWSPAMRRLRGKLDRDINGYLNAEVNPRFAAQKIRMQYVEYGQPRLRIDLC